MLIVEESVASESRYKPSKVKAVKTSSPPQKKKTVTISKTTVKMEKPMCQHHKNISLQFLIYTTHHPHTLQSNVQVAVKYRADSFSILWKCPFT
jgi:hypothetical protein